MGIRHTILQFNLLLASFDCFSADVLTPTCFDQMGAKGLQYNIYYLWMHVGKFHWLKFHAVPLLFSSLPRRLNYCTWPLCRSILPKKSAQIISNNHFETGLSTKLKPHPYHISFAVLAEADEAPRLRAAHRLKLYMSHAPLPGNVATSSLPIEFRFLL